MYIHVYTPVTVYMNTHVIDIAIVYMCMCYLLIYNPFVFVNMLILL